ncbi:DUF3383 domain-containing protein [Robbsia andropogonis]|uniref:DUF3383 domain-containing protein n=1 Tax=Robbsia andropogonis TaxID=28092 RepID=UPI003D238826
MSNGLPVSRVVSVSVSLTPVAAATRNFGAALVVGSSPVIDVNERLRSYSDIDDIATDFGTTSPEYLAALPFFSQSPQPSILYIGRWAQTATAGLLRGKILTAAQALVSNFTAITNGSFKVTVDGTARPVTGLNFSGVANLNGVASAINAVLTQATTTWDGSRFVITSNTSGAASSVGYASATGSGTDVSALMQLTSGNATPVSGIAAESLVAAINTLADMSTDWYGVGLAPTGLQNSDILAAAAYIEAAGTSRILAITTQDTATLDSTSTTDIASLLQAAGYARTFVQFSQYSPYAAMSALGRAFTVDFTGSNTTITLKFKLEPGITAETLTTSQADALKAKNCNVFANYQNGTAILQEGTMANGDFFDERHGLDWLQNDVQTEVFNLLYDQPKLPQTDQGVATIQNTIEAQLSQGVTNGLIAAGVWNGPPLGNIATGDTLSKGYYTYAPLVSAQTAADRSARKAPTIQAAIKLAGAIHFADVVISANR